MKTYSFKYGRLEAGIVLQADERLGQIVFLGEDGRGRRYEKVALDRFNPAEVTNGCVREAQPRKVTLPARDGKPERVFFVLAKATAETAAALVRVNSETSYVRGARGYWETVAGEPETLISGYGAYGDAGRVGTWHDGLVVLRPGDVLKVYPSRGSASALWMSADGRLQVAAWQDYEVLQAVAQAEATMAEAEANHEALNIAFGQLSCFTYAGDGEIRAGLEVGKGVAGPALILGEDGRGRKLTEVPIVGIAEPGDELVVASIALLSEEEIKPRYYGDKPETRRTYGLTKSAQVGDGVLVRVAANRHPHRQYLRTTVLRGEPSLIATGLFASGDAGNAGSVDDTFWVLRPGEAVVISRGMSENRRVVENRAGEPVSTLWAEWEEADGRLHPEDYIQKGKAPWGHVPAEWTGRVVRLVEKLRRYDSVNRVYVEEFEHSYEDAELVSISPFVLNLGWDGRDRQEKTIQTAVWVVLQPDKEVRRLEGEDMAEREALKAQALAMQGQAKLALEKPYWYLTDPTLKEQVEELAQADFTLLKTRGTGYFVGPSIEAWILQAEKTLAKLPKAEAEAAELFDRQNAGEVLANFEARHRRGGMTGNGDGWVIQPDGSLRRHDSDDVRRFKTDGTYHWDLVQPEELALRWSCGHMGDVAGNSQFEVAHRPVSGLTLEQEAKVSEIEREIGAPQGAFGLNDNISQVHAERLEAILSAAARILGYAPECDYFRVAGTNGLSLLDWGQLNGISDAGCPVSTCDGRSASVVWEEPVADGVLEFLAYYKYGQDNLAMRWHEEVEGIEADEPGGESVEEALDQDDPKPVEDLGAALGQLRARFNGKK